MIPDTLGKKIVEMLFDAGMIKFFPRDSCEGWMLHSAIWSPFYIQLRPVFSMHNSKIFMDIIGKEMACQIKEVGEITKLVGVASAGVPISVITSYKAEIPTCYTRKVGDFRTLEEFRDHLKKIDGNGGSAIDYGEHSFLEGHIEEGDNLILIDDLITGGESKLIAKEIIEYEAQKQKKHVNILGVAVVIDREQGGKEELLKHGLNVYSLIPFKTKGIYWLQDKLSENEFNLILDYLKDSTKYQDEEYRKELLKGWN